MTESSRSVEVERLFCLSSLLDSRSILLHCLPLGQQLRISLTKGVEGRGCFVFYSSEWEFSIRNNDVPPAHLSAILAGSARRYSRYSRDRRLVIRWPLLSAMHTKGSIFRCVQDTRSSYFFGSRLLGLFVGYEERRPSMNKSESFHQGFSDW